MSNKSRLVAVLFAAGFSLQAAAGVTFGDINSVNSDLKLQELRNKLIEAKLKDPTLRPAAAPAEEKSTKKTALRVLDAEAAPEEKIAVISIYGVGKQLSAEVRYNGLTQTVRPGTASAQLGPWAVESVTPYNVTLVKDGGTLKAKGRKSVAAPSVRRTIYLGDEAPAVEPKKDVQSFGPMMGNMLPPAPTAFQVEAPPRAPTPPPNVGALPPGLK